MSERTSLTKAEAATARMAPPPKPVFVHISKNAGTSVVATAGEHIIDAGHRTAASWVAEHGSRQPLFAVIRHPFDRVLSEYHYRQRRWRSGETNPHLANLHLPFDEWVANTFDGGMYRTRSFFESTGVPYNERNMVGDQLIWFISQCEWLDDSEHRLLVDDLLRFEQLAADWSVFSAKYGITGTLEHVNRSPRPDGAELRMSERSRRLIEEHYRDDFERFGYQP